ncbi:uncharacterized protein LOC132196513 [Neocloeon triangulifer]|uniref:uncharacterized protein LOC132196513 n=1 Tax=Neocloeon triangulifer TaxID=2078957 RepID=UPI00286F4869|nr:uncharacterized protein LOC132196513 [Neocloeon triangulifer]
MVDYLRSAFMSIFGNPEAEELRKDVDSLKIDKTRSESEIRKQKKALDAMNARLKTTDRLYQQTVVENLQLKDKVEDLNEQLCHYQETLAENRKLTEQVYSKNAKLFNQKEATLVENKELKDKIKLLQEQLQDLRIKFEDLKVQKGTFEEAFNKNQAKINKLIEEAREAATLSKKETSSLKHQLEVVESEARASICEELLAKEQVEKELKALRVSFKEAQQTARNEIALLQTKLKQNEEDRKAAKSLREEATKYWKEATKNWREVKRTKEIISQKKSTMDKDLKDLKRRLMEKCQEVQRLRKEVESLQSSLKSKSGT